MSSRIEDENRVLQVFSLSNRAAKQIDLQVHNISKENLKIGVQKAEFVKTHTAEYLKQQGITDKNYHLTTHDKGQIAKLHDWGQYHKFKSCVTGFAHYCRAEFGIKDLREIKPQMAVSFCHELADLGYAKNTVNGYISQIQKLGAFLRIDFHKDISAYKLTGEYKSLEAKDTQTRAYERPQMIIDALKVTTARQEIAEKISFSASLALNYGLRASDCCHFRCVGANRIFYNSKNGMKTIKELSPQDYERAKALADIDDKYNLSQNTLKACWARACNIASVKNSGLHGLRHNFCQNLYTDLRSRGLNHREACLVCSHELNHSRPEITETYLR